MKTLITVGLFASLALSTALQAAPPTAAPSPARGSQATSTPKRATASPVLPRLSVAEILARNLAARGGAAAWERVTSMKMSGKMDAGQERKDGGAVATIATLSKVQRKAYEQQIAAGKVQSDQPRIIQLPYTLTLQRPNKSRLEIPFQGQAAVQIYDGAHGWKLRPFLGRHEVEPFTAEELKNAASEQELDGPLVNSSAKGIQVALDGTDVVDGRATYRLKLTLRDAEVRHVWIDAQSFLETRIEGPPRHFDGKMRPVTTYMRDYRPVQGLMVARELVTTIEGTRQSNRIQIDQVAINPALDGSAFAKPM